MSEFDKLQKLAIPSAKDNMAGEEHLMHANPKPVKLISADEAIKNLNGSIPDQLKKAKADGKERLSLQVAERLKNNPPPEPAVKKEAPPEVATNFVQTEPQPPLPEAKVYVAPAPEPSEADKFLKKKGRVTIEMESGTFTVPVIDVRESQYSVCVITPVNDEMTVFVPKPGTQLSLSYKDKHWDMFCPGAYVEIDELGCGILSLIKAGE